MPGTELISTIYISPVGVMMKSTRTIPRQLHALAAASASRCIRTVAAAGISAGVISSDIPAVYFAS